MYWALRRRLWGSAVLRNQASSRRIGQGLGRSEESGRPSARPLSRISVTLIGVSATVDRHPGPAPPVSPDSDDAPTDSRAAYPDRLPRSTRPTPVCRILVRKMNWNELGVTEEDLVSFFGVLPNPVSPEEAEFFSAPHFQVVRSPLVLEFSMSASHKDLLLSLQNDSTGQAILDYRLKGIRSATLEKGEADKEWLWIKSHHGESVGITVAPSIRVMINANEL